MSICVSCDCGVGGVDEAKGGSARYWPGTVKEADVHVVWYAEGVDPYCGLEFVGKEGQERKGLEGRHDEWVH